jgi:hypothetical protein
MCTVSWIHDDSGYELFCNRDERRTRLGARDPRVYAAGDVRYIAPIDGNFGGTWIAVNQAGLTACLLNGPSDGAAQRHTSRGAIVQSIIGSRSMREALQAAGDLDLEWFAPFTLALIQPGGSSCLFEWTGNGRKVLNDAERRLPLTSSSYEPETVIRVRRDVFQRIIEQSGGVSPDALRRFHRSHQPERCAHSVCMHRHDAETVSYTRIRVNLGRVKMFYRPSAPCTPAKPLILQLCRN